mgnify:CR=1 FL=1
MRYYRWNEAGEDKDLAILPHREICSDFGDFSATFAALSLLGKGDMSHGQEASMGRREKLYEDLGIPGAWVYSPPLKHTREATILRGFPDPEAWRAEMLNQGGSDGALAPGAGIETRPKGIAVTVADCMPIWFFDRRLGAFGLLHSGWKGTGILAQAAASMEGEFGSSMEDLLAILGPAIGSCCYRVDETRAGIFSREFGSSAVTIRESGDGKLFSLNLREANLRLAEGLGIGAVLNWELCTACSSNLGSFRRQGGEGFTRMLALAVG